jgi:hypothetical protein
MMGGKVAGRRRSERVLPTDRRLVREGVREWATGNGELTLLERDMETTEMGRGRPKGMVDASSSEPGARESDAMRLMAGESAARNVLSEAVGLGIDAGRSVGDLNDIEADEDVAG